MKKNLLILLFFTFNSLSVYSQQIIADHTVVDKYSDIPQQYIDKVKEMWVIYAGESHSYGIRKGSILLESIDPVFQVNVLESGTPEAYTNQHLRLSRATWGSIGTSSGWIYTYGEEDWFTSSLAITRTKAHLTYCNTNNLQIAAMGFGWCWDMTAENLPSTTKDPFHKVGWAGQSLGGPQGNVRWGLDSDDFSITGNTVSMNTYLDATTQYINHNTANNYPTKVFFTTGPVDGSTNTGENGYQRHIKHEYIKSYVQASSDRILFDYADILCWSDGGSQNLINWTDSEGQLHSFPYIHPDNMKDLNGSYTEDGDHIGEAGAVRLAKAMWWMLARMAGWDGNSLTTGDFNRLPKTKVSIDVLANEIRINTDDIFLSGKISLYNISGYMIDQKIIDKTICTFNSSSLPSGLYFVVLTKSATSEVKKIIIL